MLRSNGLKYFTCHISVNKSFTSRIITNFACITMDSIIILEDNLQKDWHRRAEKQERGRISRAVSSMKAICPWRGRLKPVGQPKPSGNQQIKSSRASHSYRAVVVVIRMVCLASADGTPPVSVLLIIGIRAKRNVGMTPIDPFFEIRSVVVEKGRLGL